MKRFIISGTFPGEIHAIYAEKEIADSQQIQSVLQLADIDFRGAELTPEQIDWVKKLLPSLYDPTVFAQFITKLKMSFVVEGVEITFEMFYNEYGRKINGKRCREIWNRSSKVKQANAYRGISSYKRYLARENWRKQADPETYLREEYWLTDWKTV